MPDCRCELAVLPDPSLNPACFGANVFRLNGAAMPYEGSNYSILAFAQTRTPKVLFVFRNSAGMIVLSQLMTIGETRVFDYANGDSFRVVLHLCEIYRGGDVLVLINPA